MLFYNLAPEIIQEFMVYRILYTVIILNSFFAFSVNFYVAPNGNDSNNGTINAPVETIKRAQELASSGDTVYIRGGLYTMREEQIAEYYSIWAYVTKLDKDGISYLAYENETPVFDYTNITPADKRITAFYINGNNIHVKGIEVTGVQVTITSHTQSECFEIQGSNNILEQINMYDNMAIGVYILKGSNNLILNCDAYRNWDSVSQGGTGGNTDGFGCHAPSGNSNNVFRGCRAWFNSDDGFDFINSGEPVVVDNCWAFYNGYTSDFTSRGDGNGFKAGGYGSTVYYTILSKYYPIPSNTIKFSLAVGNKQSGFYSNHHLEGSNWYNNTAYRNKRNYNMLNRKAMNSTDYLTDVPGYNHVMSNNLGYEATYQELTDIDQPNCVLNNNYFDLGVTVNASDFLSVDESLLTAPRQADGSLPETDFLKLAPSSDLIDAGVDIGFEFNDAAPDLGCFESGVALSIKDEDAPFNNKTFNYPNPFTTETKVVFYNKNPSKISVSVYDLTGIKVFDTSEKVYPKGKNVLSLKRNQLSAGHYLLVLKNTSQLINTRLITIL